MPTLTKSLPTRQYIKLRKAMHATWKLDWAQVEVRRALRCLPAVAIPLVLGLIYNKPIDGLLGAAGAFAVGFGSFQSIYQSRLAPMVLASIGIALSGFTGTLIGHSDIAIALLAGLWAFGAGLLSAVGPGGAYIGTQCVIFLLVATAFPVSLRAAETLAALVFGGGMLQTLIVTLFRAAFGAISGKHGDSQRSASPARGARLALHTVRRTARRRSSAYWHAVRLALTLAVAAGGSRLIHNNHSYWMPMTAMIVLRPDFQETFTRGISRVLGTLVGAGLATLIAALLRPTHMELVALVVLFAGLTYGFLRVNYGFAAACITSYLVFLLALVGLPEPAVVPVRIAYTILGALLALVAYAYRPLVLLRRSARLN